MSSRRPGRPASRPPKRGRPGPGSRSINGLRPGAPPASNAPRSSHGALDLPPDRDPIAILAAQEADRLPELVPLRHARMAESAFAYYRGTPAVMAFDLVDDAPERRSSSRPAATPTSRTSGCSPRPSGTLVFDANDFDETLPGPWEWDVKRLAASVLIAGRSQRVHAPPQSREPTMATVAGVPRVEARYAGDAPARHLVRTHDRGRHPGRGWSEPGAAQGRRAPSAPRPLDAMFAKARGKDMLRAVDS